MILYNLRYRGPYEYEKFILNIFQFSNEVKFLATEFTNNETTTLESLNNKLKNLLDVAESLSNKLSVLRERSTNR